MRDRYEPLTRPLPAYRAQGASDPSEDLDWDPYYPAMAGEPAGKARDLGLRRLSMLTLHATGLSVVTAIGFTTVFASTAHPQATTVVAATPTPGLATAPGTRSPGPVPKAHKKKHHHHAAATTAPATASTAPAGSAPAAAPAPAPTLAPPTTAPAAAPPSPAPTQTTSSGSVPA